MFHDYFCKINGAHTHISGIHYTHSKINISICSQAELQIDFNYLARGNSYQIFDWITIQFHVLVVMCTHRHNIVIFSYHLSQPIYLFIDHMCLPVACNRWISLKWVRAQMWLLVILAALYCYISIAAPICISSHTSVFYVIRMLYASLEK